MDGEATGGDAAEGYAGHGDAAHGDAVPGREETRGGGADPRPAAVTTSSLTVWFSPRRPAALEGVDVEIRRGEVVWFVGPNGSGKSTLALACAGLIPSVVPARRSGAVMVGNR